MIGQDSVVGIATGYGLDVQGIASRGGGGEIFPIRQIGPGVHPAFYTANSGSSWGQNGHSVELATHPLLEPRLKKE